MPTPPAPRPSREMAGAANARRWTLIRDLAVFSVKALLEAVRDLVLIPLAFVAGLVGLLGDRERPEQLFRRVLFAGRRFDAWLDLFGALGDARAEPRRRRARPGAPTIDGVFTRLEEIVVDQHRRGGITVGAKQAIDRAIDTLQGERREP